MNLTKEEIDVIICFLDDIKSILDDLDINFEMKPEERELYEKITRGEE